MKPILRWFFAGSIAGSWVYLHRVHALNLPRVHLTEPL
jgi:hypothetical protein